MGDSRLSQAAEKYANGRYGFTVANIMQILGLVLQFLLIVIGGFVAVTTIDKRLAVLESQTAAHALSPGHPWAIGQINENTGDVKVLYDRIER